MRRYVILSHDHPFQHWDLMLEVGEMLRTWRLSALPEAGADIVATPLGDHRIAYLDYEGPLSGGRGRVARWDRGTYEWIENRDDEVSADLNGERLKGQLRLTRGESGNWRCTFSPANQG